MKHIANAMTFALEKNNIIAGAAKFAATFSPDTLSGFTDYEPKMPENFQKCFNMSSKQ